MSTRMFRLGLSKIAATSALGVEWLNAQVVAATVAGPNQILPSGSTQMVGMCKDFSGNLYIADNARHIIVKVTEAGEVTIVAGKSGTSGNNGNINGVLATSARFNAPEGIACDHSGTIYVADSGNNQIKSIKGGLVNVVAGAVASGFVDGDGEHARFNDPVGVCVDNGGNIYVADRLNNAVRKVKSDGHTVTLAGNGPGAGGDKENMVPTAVTTTWPSRNACLKVPSAVAVDAQGNVYVADLGNLKIKKITPDGSLFLFSGSGVSGTSLGTASATTTYAYTCEYTAPYALDADRSGNIYVVDHDTSKARIVKVDYNGRPSEVADLSTATTYKDGPYSLCVSPGQQIFVGLIY